MQTNPFTPTFGTSPYLFVGRSPIIDSFVSALEQGPGAPGRALLLSGARGVGKTTLLNELEEAARKLGWLTVSETGLPGMLERLTKNHLPRLLKEHDSRNTKRRITGLTAPAGLGGVRYENKDRHQEIPDLRSQLTELTDILIQHESGIVLTIDEVSTDALSDLQLLAAAIQHMFREDRPVALVMAGLPENIDVLFDAPGITFIRRADHHILGSVSREATRQGLEIPVLESGRTWEPEALHAAVESTRGYPYMMQLIGFHAWAVDPSRPISFDDVIRSHGAATEAVGRLVHRPALRTLTNKEVEFLQAMAVDDGPSKTEDIARRMGQTPGYVGQYRKRLLDKRMIQVVRHGVVDLPMPGLRDYLRQLNDPETNPEADFW